MGVAGPEQVVAAKAVTVSINGYRGKPARLLDLYAKKARPHLLGPETFWYSTRSIHQARRIAKEARRHGLTISVSADLGPDLLVPWRHPSLTVVYAYGFPDLQVVGLVPAEGRADVSIVLRTTSDRTLLIACAPWPVIDRVPLADPVQQWWDLRYLGGEDRQEAADRLRRAIVTKTIGLAPWPACQPVPLASLSAVMDGGFIVIADVADAMVEVGATEDYRLIGGLAVLLHIQRLGLDLPLRATGDADFGVPPYLLKEAVLVPAIEGRGYETVGNRWERRVDERRVATVDLLIPSYTSSLGTPNESATSSRPRFRVSRQPCVGPASPSRRSSGSRTASYAPPPSWFPMPSRCSFSKPRSEPSA